MPVRVLTCLALLFLAAGTATGVEFHGVVNVYGMTGAIVDSVIIRHGTVEDTVATPDWGGLLPGSDTFDFADQPGWPTDLLLFFRSGGVGRQKIIIGVQPETWYQLTSADARAKFYSQPGVAEQTGSGLPAGAFAVRPSVIGQRAVFELRLAGAGPATLEVFDAAGNPVRRFDVAADVRSVSWDGADAAGKRLAEGVYFCRLSAEGGTAVRKVLVAR